MNFYVQFCIEIKVQSHFKRLYHFKIPILWEELFDEKLNFIRHFVKILGVFSNFGER